MSLHIYIWHQGLTEPLKVNMPLMGTIHYKPISTTFATNTPYNNHDKRHAPCVYPTNQVRYKIVIAQ